MFDIREVSWLVALARFVLSLVITLGVLVGINILIYLDATNTTSNDRVAAAFRDAYDYGYAQTFNATYQQARNQAFDKGYSKGYEISQESNSGKPVSRLVETHKPVTSGPLALMAAVAPSVHRRW